MGMARQIAGMVGKVVLAFVFAFVLTLIAMVPVLLIAAFGGIRLPDSGDLSAAIDSLLHDPVFVYGAVAAQAAGFTAAVPIMYALFERKTGWRVGWKREDAIRDLLRGAGLGVALMTAIFLTMLASGAVHIRGFRVEPAVWTDLAVYLLLFAIVSINEELFSRGYVQGLVRHRFGATAAVLCSSLLFALLHALNPGALEHPLPLINLFAAGVLLGVCREWSGGLWLPIGLHWTWNYVQGNVFGYEVSGTPVASLLDIEPAGRTIWSGGAFGAEGSLIATIAMAVGVWLLWRTSGRRASVRRD